jgi:hypothetical protein
VVDGNAEQRKKYDLGYKFNHGFRFGVRFGVPGSILFLDVFFFLVAMFFSVV